MRVPTVVCLQAQVLTLLSHDLLHRPQQTLDALAAFLSIPPWSVTQDTQTQIEDAILAFGPDWVTSTGWTTQAQRTVNVTLTDDQRRRLHAAYAPHNAQLFALLGRSVRANWEEGGQCGVQGTECWREGERERACAG